MHPHPLSNTLAIRNKSVVVTRVIAILQQNVGMVQAIKSNKTRNIMNASRVITTWLYFVSGQ